jgi:hypothetical protein
MLKRLLLGLVKGLILGGGAAFAVIQTTGGAEYPSVLVAYLLAAVMGLIVALVAGKPIWSRGAGVEVGLKAAAAALLGPLVLYAARRWLGLSLDLSAWGAGAGMVGALPATSLPLVATVLAVLFELDHTERGPSAPAGRQVASAPRRVAGAAPAESTSGVREDAEDAVTVSAANARRKQP